MPTPRKKKVAKRMKPKVSKIAKNSTYGKIGKPKVAELPEKKLPKADEHGRVLLQVPVPLAMFVELRAMAKADSRSLSNFVDLFLRRSIDALKAGSVHLSKGQTHGA